MSRKILFVLLFFALLPFSGCGFIPSWGEAEERDGAGQAATTPGVDPSDSGNDAGFRGVPGRPTAEDSLPDSAVGSDVASTQAAPVLIDQTAPSVDARLDQLLVAQQALTARVDLVLARMAVSPQGPAGAIIDSAGAISDSASVSDSASGGVGERLADDSGEVLGEARKQVGSFGRNVAWSVLVIIIFNLLVRGTVWVLDRLAERSVNQRLFYKRLVPLVRLVLWLFAAYLIVRVIFRVDAQGVVAAAAAIGVAVGFASQDLLKNLFGGLILLFDQPFQVGDKIKVGGTYGEVVSIGLRSTRIVTPDDNLVSVPNAQVVDQQVANANAGELNCQVVTDLYLPGYVNEADAKKIAFGAATSSKYVYLNKPIVVLIQDEFKETFLTRVRVKAYVMDPRFEFLFQSDVTERARAGFREAGLISREDARFFPAPPSPVAAATVGLASPQLDGHVSE